MNVFYRKIIAHPKAYSLFISLLCFTTFASQRLWEWQLYLNFLIFSLAFLTFLKVYLYLLVKDITHYNNKLNPHTSPPHTTTPHHIIFMTHLLGACWLITLPAFTLLFTQSPFLKLLAFLFISAYTLIVIVRRIAYKLHISIARTSLLIVKNLALTAIVSFLPYIALITLIV